MTNQTKPERGLTAGIERWKVELSGLIYDMVNHRPSNLPHLKGLIPNFKDIEQLIETEISQAKAEQRREDVAQLKKNIAGCRQWLNEDRIDDLKKMVTSEQLAVWLLSQLKKGK